MFCLKAQKLRETGLTRVEKTGKKTEQRPFRVLQTLWQSSGGN
jgi:hypothetical protein